MNIMNNNSNILMFRAAPFWDVTIFYSKLAIPAYPAWVTRVREEIRSKCRHEMIDIVRVIGAMKHSPFSSQQEQAQSDRQSELVSTTGMIEMN